MQKGPGAPKAVAFIATGGTSRSLQPLRPCMTTTVPAPHAWGTSPAQAVTGCPVEVQVGQAWPSITVRFKAIQSKVGIWPVCVHACACMGLRGPRKRRSRVGPLSPGTHNTVTQCDRNPNSVACVCGGACKSGQATQKSIHKFRAQRALGTTRSRLAQQTVQRTRCMRESQE